MKPLRSERNPRNSYAPWIIRTQKTLVVLIIAALLLIWVVQSSVNGSNPFEHARRPVLLVVLSAVLAAGLVKIWKIRTNAKNPLLAPCDLTALLCRDPLDDVEPLVVGTSVTYAQFLNRPSLRNLSPTQALDSSSPPSVCSGPIQAPNAETGNDFGNEIGCEIEKGFGSLQKHSLLRHVRFEAHLADWTRPIDESTDRPEGNNQRSTSQLPSYSVVVEPRFAEFWSIDDQLNSSECVAKNGTAFDRPTVDELVERWINEDADAPLPEELFGKV
jgi:hypothetical protein